MKVSTSVIAIFDCSKERAFKAPILGDATRFLNGYLFQPPVIRFEEDETWGEVNGFRYPVIKGSWLAKEHRIFTDTILEREENEYWRWEVTDFTSWLLFFAKKGVGEWKVREIAEQKMEVTYSYTYDSKAFWLYPINLLFVKVQLRGMMKKAIKGIRQQAESGEPLYYEKLRSK